MRIRITAFACLALFTATPLLAQNGESPSESAWFKAYQSARQTYTFGCFGQRDPESCKKLVEGLGAAYAEMPANYQHEIFPDRMNAVASYGQVLLEADRVTEAGAVLEAGWAEVMDHYDGGRHSHTLAENLKLLRNLGSARLAASDETRAEEAFLQGRQITGAVFQHSLETRGERSDRYLQNLFDAILEGEAMETALAQVYTSQATRSPSTAAWSKVADVRGREVEWILIADDYSVDGFAEDDKRYRAALAYYEKGEAHLKASELGDDQALDAYTRAAVLFEELRTKENIEAEVEEASKWGLPAAAELQMSKYGQLGARAYAGLAEAYARMGKKPEATRALAIANEVVRFFGSTLYLAEGGDTVLSRLGLATALLID